MKKIFYILKMAVVVLILGHAASADAQSSIPEVKSGQTVTVSGSGQKYVFNAPDNGVLSIESTSWSDYMDLLYTTAACNQSDVIPYTSILEGSNGRIYEYRVAAGESYYFFVEPGMGSVQFTFKFTAGLPQPLITAIYPQPNTTVDYNFTSYPQIQIVYSVEGVKYASSQLIYQTASGEKTVELDYKNLTANTGFRTDFEIKQAVDEVKAEMLDGTIFTVSIKGANVDGVPVAGNYAQNGDITLQYKYKKQTSVTSCTYPEPFKSYWPQGSADGLVTAVFDGPLLPLSEYGEEGIFVGIFGGTLSDREDTSKELPGAPIYIDGNTLTIDLCGVQRLTTEKVVSMEVLGVLDINSNPVDFYGSAAIQIVNLPYELLTRITPLYEFDPDEGESIAGDDSVELWVGGETMQHLGINAFEYTVPELDAPVEVTDFTVSNPSIDGSVIYTVPVPAAAKAKGKVTLTAMVYTLDGYDYSGEIYVEFENDESGVSSIGSDAADMVNVFGLDGVQILRNASAESLEALPRGLYIVNGKKVVR